MGSRLAGACVLAVALGNIVAVSAQQSGRATDVLVEGELRQWHKVTLTLTGPEAVEAADGPNPFMDYRLTVTFAHESGSPTYLVPGYFAADGNAANSSAVSGNKWRAHLAPDKTGRWNYRIRVRHWKGGCACRAGCRSGGCAIAWADRFDSDRRHRQAHAGFPCARPVAVRRQALPPGCGERGILPQARRRLAGNVARLC